MGTFDYTRLRNTTSRMIRKFGQSVELTVFTQQADPTQPFNGSAATPQVLLGQAVFTDFDMKDVDGTVIRMGDQKVLLAAKDFTVDPDTQSFIRRTDESQKWTVVKVKRINPGDTKLLFILQVRA